MSNVKYVFYYTLTEKYKKWVSISSMKSGQPGINAEQCKRIKLPLPSLNEQYKIADFISSIDSKLENTLLQIEKTKEFKKGLLQQMFV